MLREQTVTQLVQQYCRLPHGDKQAVAQLLDAREQFILRQLTRRQTLRTRLWGQKAGKSKPDIFVSCSSWLSETLFELLDPDTSQVSPDGPTPAARALVRDIYQAIGGNPEQSSQEIQAERTATTFGSSMMAKLMAKFA